MNTRFSSGAIFSLGQMFIFGGAILLANSTGLLGQVDSFALGQDVRLGSMEYTVDLYGELIFSGLVSRQVQEQPKPLSLDLISDLALEEREKPLPGSKLDQIPELLPLGPMSDQAQVKREKSVSGLVSDQTLKLLSMVPISDATSDKHEKPIPGLMSDRAPKPLPLRPMSD